MSNINLDFKHLPKKFKIILFFYFEEQYKEFPSKGWQALIVISFVPTKETKQRKTPGEYKLLKLANTTKKS